MVEKKCEMNEDRNLLLSRLIEWYTWWFTLFGMVFSFPQSKVIYFPGRQLKDMFRWMTGRENKNNFFCAYYGGSPCRINFVVFIFKRVILQSFIGSVVKPFFPQSTATPYPLSWNRRKIYFCRIIGTGTQNTTYLWSVGWYIARSTG